MKPDTMTKAEILEYWRNLKPDQQVIMYPVEYKHTGSTYDQDGIRLTGSKQFIDSVLSRLKDLLNDENDDTRLQLVYKQSVDKDSGYPMDSYNCYIQVHERGHEAKHFNHLISAMRERSKARS